jgi:hypothetical protein
MEKRAGTFQQKGKILNTTEQESVGRIWISQLQKGGSKEKSMPYHYLRK